MPVECLLILPQENNQTTTDFKNESEDLTIEKYDVTLIGHYEKTIAVYADSPEQAAER